MDSAEIQPGQTIRPLPGRVIIDVEPMSTVDGSIVIPETAADQKVTDTSMFGRVVAVGYGPYSEREGDKLKRRHGITPEELPVGSRVRFLSLMDDMGAKRIITAVTRITAVIED